VGSRRENAHHQIPRGGCWELDDVVNAAAAPVCFRCRTELCRDKWRSAGFYKQEGMVAESRWRCEEGCNGQRSFNCQVHSFFNDSSIPHHPFLFILMILPLFPFLLFFSLSLFSPSHLFSLPCQYFLILFLQHLLISSTFRISWMNRNAGHRPHHSLLRPTMISSTGVYCASSANLNYRLHRSHSTFNSHLNAGVYVVAKFCLCEL